MASTYNYLGLTFSTRLSFRTGLEEYSVKAKKCVMELALTPRKLGCDSRKVVFRLFDAQVVPLLLYSLEIWRYIPQIEKVHMFACKMFLNVPIKTPSDTVYGELGRYSLHVLSMISCVKYWF